MRRSLLLVLPLLLLACSDYGVYGKAKHGGSPDDTGVSGGGDDGDGEDGDDSGFDPADDETEDPGGDDGGGDDGGDDVPLPEFTDCNGVGLWTDQWWGSMPYGHESDLTDGSGRPYYATDYEMRDYSTVSMPDEGHIPSGYDKSYRVDLWLDAEGPRIFVDLQSDDGLWVYVNGERVGQWGGGWQEEGCVNDLANCTEFVEVSAVEITDKLNVGRNVLAVRVSNAVNNSYMWVSPRCSDE